ncbi:helix-turn-helix domain-containing protein [Serratia sp. 1D1416]|uniref:helix-turn-helix domain-containing protein n=1 Tax=Serratia sp. 1D1416 TaxID=2447890 RepID=UPI001013D263|nr:helix-turn-helix transcriptional regulator [Serratia sp. 1D1416]
MAKLQYIHDESGKPLYVVLPLDEYKKLVNQRDEYKAISYQADENDDETVPHEVISIMLDQDVSLIAAWRLFRGLSQHEVAERLGTTQSAVSQWEAVDSKPQKKTREKLAALYRCRPAQTIL